MANKNMKRCLISLIIMELQVKMTYHLIPIRVPTTKNKNNNSNNKKGNKCRFNKIYSSHFLPRLFWLDVSLFSDNDDDVFLPSGFVHGENVSMENLKRLIIPTVQIRKLRQREV